ncbi:MAG TPA: hypothetical protein PLN96_05135 [Zoogloea sp.]|uniref:hypothetical protein n=1 Tax=Zoogloea sp. TaxID=49181 RepID=UPI002D14D450|nr:hypothetical protein [Zoogloea sp.]HNA67277.1 hypothetical protein [Rhodocyclaceae bacterium]HNI47221.1 hypothetical protein [Zoogloea sp.]
MNTWRETILQAVMARLASAGVAAGQVYRSRTEAFARAELPAVVVKPGGERVDNSTRFIARRRFELQFEVYVRGDPVDAIADPVLATLHQALMADPTLGGIIQGLFEDGTDEPLEDDGDASAAKIQVTYLAAYATPSADNTRLIT